MAGTIERFGSGFARGTDIMPFAEAQREPSEEVTLGWHEAVVVGHDESGSLARFRMQNNVRVFVVGFDEGNKGYRGHVPMEDGEEHPFHLKGKRVAIKPLGFVEGRRRKFEVTLAEGLRIIEPNTSEAKSE